MVKPSGGIRDAHTAKKFIEMGCHRLGNNFSSTPSICGEKASVKDTGEY
jgi:deoxyribose-phosphate aldolase